jgi:hypothetical protein
VLTAATNKALPGPRPVRTCRFVEEPTKPAPADDAVIFAVIRRTADPAAATADAAVVRRAIEDACRATARECQTEVTGDRQVRVLLAVRAAQDWRALFGCLQELPELGSYGVVFQVRVRP